jgi:hypothetical protein
MIDLNPLAIAVAVVAAFVLSSVYYATLGNQLASLSEAYAESARPPAWKILAELARSVIVVLVVGGLASLLEITTWTVGVWLGLALWIGFPVVLLAGSVIHENVPAKLAAIHAGDWLIKLVVASIIVSVWQ